MGFIGVILLLNPSFQGGQEFAALVSLAGGAMSGWAYLQVRELSLLGEPGWRVVFYLSLTGLIMSAIWSCFTGWHPLTVSSLPYLAGIGISAMIAQLASDPRLQGRQEIYRCLAFLPDRRFLRPVRRTAFRR